MATKNGMKKSVLIAVIWHWGFCTASLFILQLPHPATGTARFAQRLCPWWFSRKTWCEWQHVGSWLNQFSLKVWRLLSPWILLIILGETSIHINSQLLELEPISSLVCDTPALIRSNASFDSHCSSMSDKRVDPTTGAAVTYKELVATYKKQYKRQEIEDQGGLNVR